MIWLLTLLRGNKVRVLAAGVSTLLMLLAGIGGYMKGSTTSAVKCANMHTESIVQGEQHYEETKQQIMRLPTSDLDNRLSKWLRD